MKRTSVLVVALTLTTAVPASGSEPLDEPVRLRLLAPFASPRDALFYSGFGIPLLRSGRGPLAGTIEARARHAREAFADSDSDDGARHRVDALFIEHLRLDATVGILDHLALWVDARIGGWDERRDVFRVHASRDPTTLIIQGEQRKQDDGVSTSRHENLSILMVGALATIWRADDGVSGLAASLAVKSPGFRRGDISSSGTTDVALTAHLTLALHERVAVHGNAGVVIPIGDPWIFQHPSAFDARPFVQGAAGVTWAVTDWLALGASIEAAQSPWLAEVAFLDRPTINASGGVRLLLGRFSIEVGGGAGLSSGSADWLMWVELGYVSRPLWSDPVED